MKDFVDLSPKDLPSIYKRSEHEPKKEYHALILKPRSIITDRGYAIWALFGMQKKCLLSETTYTLITNRAEEIIIAEYGSKARPIHMDFNRYGMIRYFLCQGPDEEWTLKLKNTTPHSAILYFSLQENTT